MAYFNNISDSDIYFTSSVPDEFEAYRFPGQMSATENTSDANIYPTSSVLTEFEGYPFLSQMTNAEEVDFQADYTFADPWSMAEQSSLLASSASGFGETASYESLASASYPTHTNGYDQPYFDSYWPAVAQHTQPLNPDFLGQGVSFSSTVPEASTVVLTPGSAPLDYWWLNQSGSFISTPNVENVHSYHQSSTGPARAGMVSTGRHQPYEVSRARSGKHRNAEAGPSTLPPLPIPYVGPPPPQPSGGTISETTADAEPTQTSTEEDKVPTPKRAKLPRGQGPLRRHRVKMDGGRTKLCDWARRRLRLREAPSFNMALAIAFQDIQMIRPLVSQEHQLFTGHGERTTVGSKRADAEVRRRDEEREWFRKLSKYYPLGRGQGVWVRPSLLSRVMRDLEDLPPLAGPSNNPPP